MLAVGLLKKTGKFNFTRSASTFWKESISTSFTIFPARKPGASLNPPLLQILEAATQSGRYQHPPMGETATKVYLASIRSLHLKSKPAKDLKGIILDTNWV